MLVVGVWAKLNDRRQKSPQANVVLFAVIGTYGIVLWFLYNLIIFHDPLYFLHSAYSAQAINEAQAQFAGTKGDAWTSILTYGWDMIGILGAPVLIAGGVSSIMLLAIRHPERKRTIFTLALLGAPVLFEFVSLYVGQTTIRVPQLFPYGMWNDRYGIMALPFCAVAIGVLVDRWRWTLALAVPATAAAFLIMALGTPLTIADGRTGTSSAAGGHPETAAAYLSRHYRGGEILADDSAASSLIFASNLDLTTVRHRRGSPVLGLGDHIASEKRGLGRLLSRGCGHGGHDCPSRPFPRLPDQVHGRKDKDFRALAFRDDVTRRQGDSGQTPTEGGPPQCRAQPPARGRVQLESGTLHVYTSLSALRKEPTYEHAIAISLRVRPSLVIMAAGVISLIGCCSWRDLSRPLGLDERHAIRLVRPGEGPPGGLRSRCLHPVSARVDRHRPATNLPVIPLSAALDSNAFSYWDSQGLSSPTGPSPSITIDMPATPGRVGPDL